VVAAPGPPTGVHLFPLVGLPEVAAGDDLSALLGDAIDHAGGLEDGDVLVVAHKVVSKAEGRVARAATRDDHRALVLSESRRVRRHRGDLLIVETRHGFVCATAGVDQSNTPGDDLVVLLPLDPDASAATLRSALEQRFGVTIAVVVSDSFGRAWRHGTMDIAVGVAGMLPILDLQGQPDRRGRILETTQIAVADELASAAELVMGKTTGRPGAIIRGYETPLGDGRATDLVMPRELDLFP
jgi:coenzyme F420-0:L-glutamate ligase/coenzyme F420-1:gamma-L-glutamate ligase